MRSIIREIAIFGENNNDKKGVTFSHGLNIITGESQTGKSALIEIVDYCLLASTSTIPRGKIVDFGEIFAIVLEVDNKYIVIGRPSPRSLEWTKFYFKIEVLESMIENLQKTYFESLNLITKDSLRAELGRFFNFDVPDISTEKGLPTSKTGMASIRNMTPYLFQHQSLIANKHALFYRFDNREKQERIISEFPVFMGWVSAEYYRKKRELDEKTRRLRQLKLQLEEIAKNKEKSKQKIENFVKDYFHIIGKECPTFNDISDVIKVAKELPDFDDRSYLKGECETRKVALENDRDKLTDQKQKIIRDIELLEIASKDARSYNTDLSFLTDRSKFTPCRDGGYTCPLCEQSVESLNKQIDAVTKSRISLFDDLKKLKSYARDNSKTLERLKKERSNLNDKILSINGEIDLLKRASINETTDSTLKERAAEIKQTIRISIDITFGDSNILQSDQEILDLSEEIKTITKELEKFDFSKSKNIFEENLAHDMNEICSELDFEKELCPPQLFFDISNFTFSHRMPNGDKISLSEMGSGANWLACHLSLFLSLHRQFARNKNCSVPSFIFFDQPSQVYFPTDSDFSRGSKGDIQKVTEVYDVILETLNAIKKESGYLPQVIVTDHADDLPLKNGTFENFVRRRWRNGEKLI